MSRASLGLAIGAALASATAFGASAAVQHEQAAQVAHRGALDPALLSSLAKRPLWLLGIAGDVVAVALQAVALRFGPVVLVQPLLVAGLPVAVVVSAAIGHRSVSPEERRGLVLCCVGLALLVPATATHALGHPAGWRTDTAVAVTLAVAVGGLLGLARLRPRAAPLGLGLAAGICVGAGSVLLSICAGQLGHLGHLLRQPTPYAAAALAVVGLLVTQASFQTGSIAAPLAALSLSEPVVAVVLAVLVLHEHLHHGLATVLLGLLGSVSAALGVLALSLGREAPQASPQPDL